VLRVASDCLLWPHRILVVSRSLFVLRIERVLYFLRQCVEPPVRFTVILGGGGWSELVRVVAHWWSATLRAVVLLLCIFHWSSLQLPIILMVCILAWITACILKVCISDFLFVRSWCIAGVQANLTTIVACLPASHMHKM